MVFFVLTINGIVVSFYNGKYEVLNEHTVGFLAGQHASQLGNSEVRVFSASMNFFFPFVPKHRISAELKGTLQRKMHPKSPHYTNHSSNLGKLR